MTTHSTKKLRSRAWFDNADNVEMTALYLERYLNYGITREELQSNKPIIAIAQTGSDLSPCNRHHLTLATRIRDGIIANGGIPLEVPVHPIQETGKRPTAMLDRNLAYLSLVETLFGYPIDGVVLTIGCDKTTPALLMAASTVNIPAIAFSVGPMLNSWVDGKRAGSGTTIWQARKQYANDEISAEQFIDQVAATAPSVGYCNTMGTASTMNSLTEALGMQLSGSAAIPAPYKERGQMAYQTGQRIVELVQQDIKPSDIMTRSAFENAIVCNTAIGGSTNAPIHLIAIAKQLAIELTVADFDTIGYQLPLLVNMQPAGEYLSEDFYRAGGMPAVIGELIKANLLKHPQQMTVNGHTIAENAQHQLSLNEAVIKSVNNPLKHKAGFLHLSGNLFDSAIMKTSVISQEVNQRYLSDPKSPMAFEGRAIVFDGPQDFHDRIDDPSLNIDEYCLLVMRGAGPIGYPGGAEVVNMRPPSYLLAKGINELPCIGDGRQSGTSASPSILNASPEAALNAGLALLQTNDIVRVDLNKRQVNMLVDDQTIAKRKQALINNGGYPFDDNQTPWQQIFRDNVSQFDQGMVLKNATSYQKISEKSLPKDNH